MQIQDTSTVPRIEFRHWLSQGDSDKSGQNAKKKYESDNVIYIYVIYLCYIDYVMFVKTICIFMIKIYNPPTVFL